MTPRNYGVDTRRDELRQQIENDKYEPNSFHDEPKPIPPWHVHDYQMAFSDDPNHPFDFTLTCVCGDSAPDMETALARTEQSRRGPIDYNRLVTILFVICAFVFLVYAVVSR